MTTKEIILKQMKACDTEKEWIVPLSLAISGLSAKQAAWKDGSANHSIWQIVNHLIFWNTRYLNKLKGALSEKYSNGHDVSFTNENYEGTDIEWNLIVENVNKLMSDWETSIQQAEPDTLAKPVSSDNIDNWYAVISNINIHNAYHIGQIVNLRKLQGCWHAELGVQ
ncbi:MAG: hypothetical protein JWN78_1943 [Bacteroidota bacterium]|nr:hypothetical protein [Bacteroidota bacterium]